MLRIGGGGGTCAVRASSAGCAAASRSPVSLSRKVHTCRAIFSIGLCKPPWQFIFERSKSQSCMLSCRRLMGMHQRGIGAGAGAYHIQRDFKSAQLEGSLLDLAKVHFG